jgi:hypothetical protein
MSKLIPSKFMRAAVFPNRRIATGQYDNIDRTLRL